MKKAKRRVDDFVNHLFGIYKVPRIPVYIHWYHHSVVDANGHYGFGVFCYDDDEKPCIHVACKQIKTTQALFTVAHEFVHYLQYLHGWIPDNGKESELAAEHFGAGLLGQWLVNNKDKHLRIDGLLRVWEKCPEGVFEEE